MPIDTQKIINSEEDVQDSMLTLVRPDGLLRGDTFGVLANSAPPPSFKVTEWSDKKALS